MDGEGRRTEEELTLRSILREGREWELAELPDASLVGSIRGALGCSDAFATLLAQRAGDSWRSLIELGIRSFHSPFLLKDMDAAVERLRRAIDAKERIFVHGDFDVDGLSGAAVLYRGLRPLLPENSVKVEVSERSVGHGLSPSFALRAIDEKFNLVVTVDCGVGNHQEIDRLREAGIDTVVTDHHLPVGGLPNAVAIVDPHREDATYPNKNLAGVGVAFKLICALYERMGRTPPYHLLDLVALGTIADIVPLSSTNGESENRAFVREAFAAIAKGEGSSLGLRMLMERLTIKAKSLSASDIGYLIAPKLNAANRAGDPKVAFLLLVTEDRTKAEYLSEILLDYNRDREIAQNDLMSQAEDLIRGEERDPRQDGYVFLVGKYWNAGILGLVASNLADRYRVPAFVLSKGDRTSRGSCRSANGFNMSACLEAQADLLLQFGGHKAAAGFAVANENIESLEAAIEAYVADHQEEETEMRRESIDTRTTLPEIDARFHADLMSLSPFGLGNPQPRFLLENCTFEDLILVGNRKQHLKGRVTQGTTSLPFIAFRKGKHLEAFEQIDNASLVCQIGFDDWQGAVQAQGIDLVHPRGTDQED